MFGNFRGGRSLGRAKSNRNGKPLGTGGSLARNRRPVFEMLEQRAMLTTVYSPLPATTDGSTGSLRADLALANADAGSQPDIIQLSAGTYNLTSGSGELDITNTTHTIIIDGAGMGQTTIDQHVADRVFNIAAGATVIFENLEITGGDADTDTTGGTTAADGGGILNQGTVTLTSVEVDHNAAEETTAGETGAGGGIYSSGALTINGGSVISDNNAVGATGAAGGTGGYAYGGGIYANTPSAVTITGSTIGGNDALAGSGGNGTSTAGGTAGIAYGGGIYISSASGMLSNDTIDGNMASGGDGGTGAATFDGGDAEFAQGGGVFIGTDLATIVGSTISGNTVTGGSGGAKGAGGADDGIGGLADGGGIEVTGTGSQLLNDTVYGNTATGGAGRNSGSSYGGGIDDFSGGLTIVNTTVAANTAAVVAAESGGTTGTPFGGGIDNNTSETPGDSNLVLYNVLDATNTAAGSPDLSGAAATATNNLIGNGTGSSGVTNGSSGNQVGTTGTPINPLFSASGLVNNGGSTSTVTLQTGSTALGAGNVAAAISYGLTTDQRGAGFARVVNNAVDIGAVEAQSASATTSLLAVPNPSTVGQTVTFTAIVTPSGGSSGTPTGTVQFKDGGTNLGTAQTLTLVNGQYEATYTTSALTVGSHTITAVYSGDTNFTTSTSPSVSQVVNTASTSTSLVAVPNPTTVGQTVTFTAIVAPTGGGSGTPTGTVQFKDGGSDIGSAQTLTLVNGAYQATYTTSSLTVGPHMITAVYSGDTNFSTSTSSSVTETIDAAAATTQTVDLSTDYNLAGIVNDGTTFSSSGGLDGQGNALSETEVGRTLSWNGITFPIGAPNVPDVVQANGQVITLSAGSYSGVSLLATSTNGNQTSQQFSLNYSNGTSTIVTLNMSDWHTPQNYSDESVALTSNYRDNWGGAQDTSGPFIVYGYSLPVNPALTLDSITLPGNTHVKILSMALVAPVSPASDLVASNGSGTSIDLTWTGSAGTITGYNIYRGTIPGGESATPIATVTSGTTSYVDSSTVAGNTYYYTVKAINYPAMSVASDEASATATPSVSGVTQVDLSSNYNLLGISANNTPFTGGGQDGAGNAYSSAVVGTSQTVSGITYNIGQAGSNDVVQADGQAIGLPVSANYTNIDILAAAVNGAQLNQTFTVHYTNGTSQQFTQSLSDWHVFADYAGESVAVTSTYRNTSTGGQDTSGPFDIYHYSFALTIPSTYDIQSITLPNNNNVIVYAITVS
ncbi:MAG TPA: Ig-like domain repeat protein [Pirellulales bacterium]|nr:Ig-like domain repeat protein [Pirellulales bacterium]